MLTTETTHGSLSKASILAGLAIERCSFRLGWAPLIQISLTSSLGRFILRALSWTDFANSLKLWISDCFMEYMAPRVSKIFWAVWCAGRLRTVTIKILEPVGDQSVAVIFGQRDGQGVETRQTLQQRVRVRQDVYNSVIDNGLDVVIDKGLVLLQIQPSITQLRLVTRTKTVAAFAWSIIVYKLQHVEQCKQAHWRTRWQVRHGGDLYAKRRCVSKILQVHSCREVGRDGFSPTHPSVIFTYNTHNTQFGEKSSKEEVFMKRFIEYPYCPFIQVTSPQAQVHTHTMSNKWDGRLHVER